MELHERLAPSNIKLSNGVASWHAYIYICLESMIFTECLMLWHLDKYEVGMIVIIILNELLYHLCSCL
uniref:Uncharacterized protein n=1 Tax=Arundo donax TaxID=35708 RepID=A0A0A8YBX5_ARUDO